MQIYNTLTKKKEEFIPISENKVTMYVCGPTVYDYFHIGNARSFIMSDIIRRYLEYKKYDVKFVMNLTDVDDKIIKKANTEGVESNKVAQKFTEAFFEDIKKLKIKPATVYPKATDHIKEIIDIIKKIEENGFAYNKDGNVFFDVVKFKEYGKLSGKNIDDLISGARIEINEEKENPLDFALWKKAKENEPYWESPWGNGRPGWHIECSAMSTKHLGETIDIHAGGNDLIFPHHENEIAQSECASNKKFVNYWLHFGFLNINDEKMSKSLGNFFTVRDILKSYSAESIRLLFNQSHYASPLNFKPDLLDAAQKGLDKITNLIERLDDIIISGIESNSFSFNVDEYYILFNQAMDDDFNTPKAVAIIFDFIRDVNKYISENEVGKNQAIIIKEFIINTAENVLGIIPTSNKENNNNVLTDKLIELLIKLRIDAKLQKNYGLADIIRKELELLGITLQDTKSGTTFKIN
ncbi:MAG TPA: cysteine--tRNA ligase [Melioribacteraceae bacterium]|nr:cysteine--tRNA ligase [Melioribacteraceae bacterium]